MKHKTYFIFIAVFFLISIGRIVVSEAAVVEVNLDKMIRSAGMIAAGRCLDVKMGFHPQYKNVKVTFITLELFDVLKGKADSKYEFMQYGNRLQNLSTPHYKNGEELMLFLYPESQYGFTSPVGGPQGKLSIQIDSVTGKRSVIKGTYNTNIFKGMDLEKLSNGANMNSPSIDYDDFKQLIKRLIEHQTNEGDAK